MIFDYRCVRNLTRVLVVRNQAKDMPRLAIDIETHSQLTEGELNHKMRVTIS